jgi:hypothetical protein
MGNPGANAGLATNCTASVNFNTTSSGCNSYGDPIWRPARP